MSLFEIGYWSQEPQAEETLPWPGDFVDPDWDPNERDLVAAHIEKSLYHTGWRGYSGCRLCGKLNGTKCLTDGVYRYPEGFAHYIRDHNVRPPQEFIDHVRKYPVDVGHLMFEFKAVRDGLVRAHEKENVVFDDCPTRKAGLCEPYRIYDNGGCYKKTLAGGSSAAPWCVDKQRKNENLRLEVESDYWAKIIELAPTNFELKRPWYLDRNRT